MIKTKGDFVSDIRNSLKAVNKDDYISARYILSTAQPYIDYIINNRPLFKLYRDRDVFTECTCIEMKQIKKYECDIAEFRSCDKIMRSKKKLPKILTTKFGDAIEYVLNMVNGEEYEPLRNAADFANSKKRQFGHLFKYYYITNDYLYLLNSTAERVNISAAFLDENCGDCKDCDTECKSKLDEKFVCPAEYLSMVREQVLQIILNGRAKLVEDTNPDLDNNQKQRTN